MEQLIKLILEKYPIARATTDFAGKHQIHDLFQKLRNEISNLDFIKNNPNLIVKSSYGKGNWAAVPWLAILDSRETDTTQDGTYVVFLFREDGKGCHLKLAQGVTVLFRSMRTKAVAELTKRAECVRDQFPEMKNSDFDLSGDPRLDTENKLAKLYESSTIFSKYWTFESIPPDAVIKHDLSSLIDVYQKFVINKLSEITNEELLSERHNRIWAIAAGENGIDWENFKYEGIVSIGWDDLGDLSQFSTREEITEKLAQRYADGRKPTNDSLCCFQFSHDIKIGDYVVAKIGRKKILGVGVVESDYIFDSSRNVNKHIRKVKWLKTEESEFPGTGTTTKTLTEISFYPRFVSLVETYLGLIEENSESEEIVLKITYSIDNIINDGCFLDRDEIQNILRRLRDKKNLILQGPPGTGKTWLAKRLAYALMGQSDHQRLRAVQFHPNLSYEDFIRGWRPSGDGKLSLVDGAFMEAVEDARNTTLPYIVVIEEINRGNPAQIFGEMLTLLEADKRNPDEALELSYRRAPNERVYIPSNLYVIGTMNIADRSLALVDLALRRRFAFVNLEPRLNQAWRNWLTNHCGVAENVVNEIENRINQLNETISSDPSLGPQFKIGHSYVTPYPDNDIDDAKEWFRQVVETEIAPLLNEYWFDSPNNALSSQERLLQGL